MSYWIVNVEWLGGQRLFNGWCAAPQLPATVGVALDALRTFTDGAPPLDLASIKFEVRRA